MSDPITEAAAMLAAHPDPMVRLIAERLAGARVRRRAAGLSRDDVARRIGCRGRSSPTPRHGGLGCRRLRRPIAGRDRPAPTAANRVRSAVTLLHGSAGWRRELGGVGRRPLP